MGLFIEGALTQAGPEKARNGWVLLGASYSAPELDQLMAPGEALVAGGAPACNATVSGGLWDSGELSLIQSGALRAVLFLG